MDFLMQIILPYILLYKYIALFIITFLSSLAIPVPAGAVLIASSAFASQGYLNITIILVVVIFANIIGDNLSYWLARLYGNKVFYRIPFLKRILTSDNFSLVERGVNKHLGFIIILSRFEVLSNLTINIICGLGKVNYKKFMIFEIIGTFVSVLFYVIIGYSFGNSWQSVNKLIGNFSILFFLFIVLALSLFGKKIIKRLKRNI